MPSDLLTESLHLLRRLQGNGKKYAFLKRSTAQVFFTKERSLLTSQKTVTQTTEQQASPEKSSEPQPSKLAEQTFVPSPPTPAPTKITTSIMSSSTLLPTFSQEKLEQITQYSELENYYQAVCNQQKIPHILFGEGNIQQAQVLFISESPIIFQTKMDKIFTGPAGELLDKMMIAMNPIEGQGIYHTSIVKTPLPNNRGPSDLELATWKPLIEKQIQLIQPQAIVLLGNKPLITITERSGIGSLRGQWMKYKSIPTMPTYHPLYVVKISGTARERQIKSEIWNDLKLVMVKVGWELKKK